MAKLQNTPKPELYAARDGWRNIIHMYESMYKSWILGWNWGFPRITNVDRTFVIITQYMVEKKDFPNVTERL